MAERTDLVIVGYMNVTGPLVGTPAVVNKAEKKSKEAQMVVAHDGEIKYSKSVMLRSVIKTLHNRGRFFEMRLVKAEDPYWK